MTGRGKAGPQSRTITPHELVCEFIDFLCREQRPPSQEELCQALGVSDNILRRWMDEATEAGYFERSGNRRGVSAVKVVGLQLGIKSMPELSELPL